MAFRPLEGTIVLAVEHVMTGPYCSKLLADFGADVIKVESPGTGDVGRQIGPIAKGRNGEPRSVFFARANSNKRSVTLNLKSPEGKEILKSLIRKSDVFMVNQTPRSLTKLEIDYASVKAVKEEIVYASITGFGLPMHEGEGWSERKAFDIVIQAMSGVPGMIEGDDIVKNGWLNSPVADLCAGIYGALGIVAAVLEREKSGRGNLVDISMYEVLTSLNERWLATYSVLGEKLQNGSGHGASSPWGIYEAADGSVAIATAGDVMWPKFCEVIGRSELADHPDFAPAVTRARNHAQVKAIIEDWARDKSRAEVEKTLSSAGIAVGPVQDVEDIFNCPILRQRGLWQTVPDPVLGDIELIGNPLSYTDGYRSSLSRSPELGENTEEVLTGMLGIDAAEIERLRRNGAV